MLRGFRHLAVASSVLLLLAGCGEGEGGDQQQGRLVVRESLPPAPLYVEGSVGFLRVEQTDSGEVIVDGPATDDRPPRGRLLFSRAVEPGEYRLVSYQRPCQGNCVQLDPPTDRCEATVDVEPGETLTATVVLRQEGGCIVREG